MAAHLDGSGTGQLCAMAGWRREVSGGLVQASGVLCSGGMLEKDGAAFGSLGEHQQQQGILLICSDDISISPFYLINMISLTGRVLS